MARWIVTENVSGMPDDALIAAAKNCYSIENHAAHGIDSPSVEYVGTMCSESNTDRLYVIYREKGGSYWYKSFARTENGNVELYEHIFGGRPDRRRRAGK